MVVAHEESGNHIRKQLTVTGVTEKGDVIILGHDNASSILFPTFRKKPGVSR
jgi:hypothetical protein